MDSGLSDDRSVSSAAGRPGSLLRILALVFRCETVRAITAIAASNLHTDRAIPLPTDRRAAGCLRACCGSVMTTRVCADSVHADRAIGHPAACRRCWMCILALVFRCEAIGSITAIAASNLLTDRAVPLPTDRRAAGCLRACCGSVMTTSVCA